jgi:CheY-like chemotaxis protein
MDTQPAVLYVEDDQQSQMVMRMLLKNRMGLTHVTILDNSRDFLARVSQLTPPPDIIFLDIHVQPLSGFEMLALLREHPQFQSIPIVALTASVMNEEVAQLRAAGFNGCLAKPVDLTIFPDTFQRLLAGEVIWRIIN